MSSWGTRRRNFIIVLFLSGLFIILAVIGFKVFYKAPNCFDGRRNQGELGVDCGGPCAILCKGEAIPPLVKWNRYFEVVPGIYNAVAYIQNQNTDARTDNLTYKFTLYEDNGAILAEETATVKIRPAETIPVVEGAMNTGSLVPARMSFEILNEIVWERDTPRQSVIRLKNEKLAQDSVSPRVSAIVENIGYITIQNIDLIIILYNQEGNAIGVSSTYIDEILPAQSQNILFTWPQNFVGEVARFEITPLYETN